MKENNEKTNGNISWGSLVKLIGVLITMIGLSTGLIVWVTGESDRIRDWAFDQDQTNRKEMLEVTQTYYVTQKDFVRLEIRLEQQQQDITSVKNTVNKIYDDLISIRKEKNNEGERYR